MPDTPSIPLVRSSERGSFKKCPRQWHWSYVTQIVPVSVELGARDFGTGWHLAMAEYYVPGKKRGRPLQDTWEEWCEETRRSQTLTEKSRKKWESGGKEAFEEMAEMGRFMLSEYMREYGKLIVDESQAGDGGDFVPAEVVCDPEWEVICREETFAANIANKAINVGTIDLVIRNSEGEVWVVDHKTGKGFPSDDSYNLDDQGGSYGAIATNILRRKKLIGPKERVKGVIFSFARKATEDKRPQNADGLYCNQPKKADYARQIAEQLELEPGETIASVEADMLKNTLPFLKAEAEALELTIYGEPSKVQPSPIFKRYEVRRTASQQKHQLQRVIDDVSVMDMARRGEIPILKSPSALCPYCDFFQLCQLEESRGDTESLISTVFKHRDPYHDHRDGAENSKLTVAADKHLKRGE